MKIWLGQNFLICTAPRSLDKRHGQVRKCRRNLTSYSSASDLAPYNTKCCEKVNPLYHVGRPPALKLKNWNTEKLKNSQIPWKRGLAPHTRAYRRWYLSATTHCEYLTKRSLSVHITEIVCATNSVFDRTEMNIYELNELDSSVRSNAIGGFRLKHCPEFGECLVTCKWLFFQKHQHKSREVNCRQPAPVRLDYHKSPSL